MKSHLALAATLALPLLAAGPAAASPISYGFTGTLNTPFNGSREFSGTVTFDSDPTSAPLPISQSWLSVSEHADITLNAGGHSFEFSSQDPNTQTHRLDAGFSPTWYMNRTGPSQDEIVINGAATLRSPSTGGVSFVMTSYVPSSLQDLADLRTLQIVPALSSVSLNYSDFMDGQFYNGTGTITSFTPIATPEPSTWLIALMAGGAAALRLRRSA